MSTNKKSGGMAVRAGSSAHAVGCDERWPTVESEEANCIGRDSCEMGCIRLGVDEEQVNDTVQSMCEMACFNRHARTNTIQMGITTNLKRCMN